jgi:rfaE bifunctional protein kinase chain/domain
MNDFARYSGKIKSVAEVLKAVGSRPRQQKLVMCHGTFDIVHPGHIRHLIFAKSKGDLLLASITCDAHITKANMRPYVPEDLRAINLAAFEIVDFVIIDRNPAPLENIEIIQPDFFCKGYEYFHSGAMHHKTREEADVVESYGGEVIFTPGDVVYSSSHIIESQMPDLAKEKLALLMDAEGVSFDDLRKTLANFKGRKVHVVGDSIVDSLTRCSVIGGMTKTPTMSVRHEQKEDYVGGAAVVAKHLREAGADVMFTTVLGNDEYGKYIQQDLVNSGVTVNAVIDDNRPTTNKNAIVVDGYRLLKVDTVDNRAISDKILDKVSGYIATSECEAVVFSDFRHGIFAKETIPSLIKAIPKNQLKIADSQVASRWGNILDFKDFDLITPNEREARFALGDQDSVIRPLGTELYERCNCSVMILKVGEKGVMVFRNKNINSPRAFFNIDAFCKNAVDAVGAGDAMLAYSTLGIMVSKNPVIAAILGSFAAAIECEQDGNIPVKPENIVDMIDRLQSLNSRHCSN